MKLTLPVSHLIHEGNVGMVPGVGALEYKSIQPMLDHPGLRLFHSNRGIIEADFPGHAAIVLPYARQHGMTAVSFDIGPTCAEVVVEDYYYVPRSEPLSQPELLELSAIRLDALKKDYNGIIALENLNYFPTLAYATVCDTEFICRVIRENQVHLVLDIGHALVSAYNFGLDPMDYFYALPLERVYEIHLSAPGQINGVWRDLHQLPGKREMAILTQLLPRCPLLNHLAVECYQDFDAVVAIYRDLEQQFGYLV